MNQTTFTVFFEEPFWVGIYERTQDGMCEAYKITFGAQPKDAEILALLQTKWNRLRFSPPIAAETKTVRCISPKRMQREITRQMRNIGAGTKAQQALKLQQEPGKQQRKARSREEKDAERERQYELHREKRRQKHRGH